VKNFSFPLDRVLHWRRAQALVEEAKLDQLRTQIHALDQRRENLAQSVTDAGRNLVALRSVSPHEIGALEHYRAAAARQSVQLLGQRRELELAATRQLQTVIDRRRDARLLERLRERRLAEWRTAAALEGEQLAAESHLARYVREISHRASLVR
jgi:hypothetical protein